MWCARPDFLPTGSRIGSRAPSCAAQLHRTRTAALAHDAALRAYLGEMIDYTPGAHLLTVLAGRVACTATRSTRCIRIVALSAQRSKAASCS